MDVNDVIRIRIQEAARKVAAARKRRAELDAARQAGLARRRAARLRNLRGADDHAGVATPGQPSGPANESDDLSTTDPTEGTTP